jgi:hypothetical protein
MTEAEIEHRVNRVYSALQEKTGLRPEEAPLYVRKDETGVSFYQDFRGGRTPVQLESDAAHVINEIMGIRDRAKKWLARKGDDPAKVDAFIRSKLAVALVHDLANTDKHGELDYRPMSGHKPVLVKVDRAMALKYDPATGKYETNGHFIGKAMNMDTGEVSGRATRSNTEVVLISDINDENGSKIGELQGILPEAVFHWEQFLSTLGLSLT